jgi:hypothetical protein
MHDRGYVSAAVWVSAATRISNNMTKITEPLTSSRISLGISAFIKSSGCICIFLYSGSARSWPWACPRGSRQSWPDCVWGGRLKRASRLVWRVTALSRDINNSRSFALAILCRTAHIHTEEPPTGPDASWQICRSRGLRRFLGTAPRAPHRPSSLTSFRLLGLDYGEFPIPARLVKEIRRLSFKLAFSSSRSNHVTLRLLPAASSKCAGPKR